MTTETLESLGISREDVIREFIIARLLQGRGAGSSVADSSCGLPECYGTYGVYDGLDVLAYGLTRNIRKEFERHRQRLAEAAMGLFVWTPDADGSVAHWLDDDHADELPRVCTECGRERVL